MTWFSCQLDECPASWKRVEVLGSQSFALPVNVKKSHLSVLRHLYAISVLQVSRWCYCLELKFKSWCIFVSNWNPWTFIKHAYQLDPVFFGTLCSRLWAMWEWMLAAKRLGCGALWTFEFVGPLACLVYSCQHQRIKQVALTVFLNMFQHFLVSSVLDKIVPNHSRWVGNFKTNSALKFEQDQPRLSGSHLC